MKSALRHSLIGLLSSLVLVIGAPANADTQRQLVTIVTSSAPQTQLMAMVLSMQVAQQGADVHILLCDGGGDMALEEAPASVLAPQKPKGMSSQGLFRMLLDKGLVTAEVCAIYLPNADQSPEVLVEGVGVADPAAMGARLIADGAQVMSF